MWLALNGKSKHMYYMLTHTHRYRDIPKWWIGQCPQSTNKNEEGEEKKYKQQNIGGAGGGRLPSGWELEQLDTCHSTCHNRAVKGGGGRHKDRHSYR